MATAAQVSSFLGVVHRHGIKELDTARVYNAGKSEELLGAVSAHSRFAVSTKAPAFAPGSLSERNILDNCAKTTSLEEQCRAINTLHREGRFDRFGVSNISDAEVQEMYDICVREGYVLPTVYQGGYNPIGRGPEKTLFPLLRKLDMSFYAFSPLAGGLLAKPLSDIPTRLKGRGSRR
ncbi:uncharacterized protein A1O9_05769 [Exophiala aquamarina CBS 119918]|uniref:NADP-dependent oxidoreductase domain-containing protein n=1 Tax=Exophiala aquamarina CBS 119918 TaxID=1182545 RepID=A0A072PF23_9EURO|nr:uncharacterized protein A1O9_05769 [Exophiala aquamarina CBS 119918]KEF57848.1 hypothetical protein A1O9_05769 [Exophiala aquamarina CBS 119918]